MLYINRDFNKNSEQAYITKRMTKHQQHHYLQVKQKQPCSTNDLTAATDLTIPPSSKMQVHGPRQSMTARMTHAGNTNPA